jgi:hypothetical protein
MRPITHRIEGWRYLSQKRNKLKETYLDKGLNQSKVSVYGRAPLVTNLAQRQEKLPPDKGVVLMGVLGRRITERVETNPDIPDFVQYIRYKGNIDRLLLHAKYMRSIVNKRRRKVENNQTICTKDCKDNQVDILCLTEF